MKQPLSQLKTLLIGQTINGIVIAPDGAVFIGTTAGNIQVKDMYLCKKVGEVPCKPLHELCLKNRIKKTGRMM